MTVLFRRTALLLKRAAQLPVRFWFPIACLGALALRVAYLGSVIDGPHSWRQCDTASYTRNFFRDGAHLLAPSVNWLGAHRTLLLEFALPEAIVAQFYRLFWPSLLWDRLVYFAFFVGAAVYFFRIVRSFTGDFVARVAVAVYAFLPLSVFYSRAIHVDFAAVCFAHGFLYHAASGYRRRHVGQLLTAMVMGIAAYLIKAPYVFYLSFPLAVLALLRLDRQWVVRLGAVVVIPMAVFLGWRHYADVVNARVPDLSFEPAWYPQINMGWWYYGTLAQRLDFANWKNLLYYRSINESLGELGLLLVLAGGGLFLFSRRISREAKMFFGAWALGLVVYLLIFFNLNLEMDYYQIPFLALWAIAIAVVIDAIHRRSAIVGVVTCLVVLGVFASIAEARFFIARPDRILAAEIIKSGTPQNALVIAVDRAASMYSYPCTLYEADRFGWAVSPSWLNKGLVDNLKAQGATHLALYTDDASQAGLHQCPFCGRPIVLRHPTPAGSLVSTYELSPQDGAKAQAATR